MDDRKLETYTKIDWIKCIANTTVNGYYKAVMSDMPWGDRVKLVNEFIEEARKSLDELEEMAK